MNDKLLYEQKYLKYKIKYFNKKNTLKGGGLIDEIQHRSCNWCNNGNKSLCYFCHYNKNTEDMHHNKDSGK